MANNNSGNSNQLVVPGVRQALDQMKNEIAAEFGVQMGPDASARANGSVGGEITKRLVRQAQATNEGLLRIIVLMKSCSGIIPEQLFAFLTSISY